MMTPIQETVDRIMGPCFPGKTLTLTNTRESNGFNQDHSRYTLSVKEIGRAHV